MTPDTILCQVQAFLPAAAPFDFGATLRFVRGFPAMSGEQGTDGDVLSQAVREAGALALVRLRAAAGRRGDLAQLLALSEEQLAQVIGNSRKASYLYRAVRLWAEVDEDFLRAGDYAAVREWLLGLPGTGPWSASFVLIRGLGRTEHMAPDKEALRAATRVYGHPVSEDEFTELAARYGRWQGYWGHYLRVAG